MTKWRFFFFNVKGNNVLHNDINISSQIAVTLSFFFNWCIDALQCCVSFCCTAKWISYINTYTPSFLDLPPTPISLGHHRAPSWVPSTQGGSFPLGIYLTHDSVYMSVPISQCILPLSPTLMSTCTFCSSALKFFKYAPDFPLHRTQIFLQTPLAFYLLIHSKLLYFILFIYSWLCWVLVAVQSFL